MALPWREGGTGSRMSRVISGTALRTPSLAAHCAPESGTCFYLGMTDLVDC